MECFEKKKLRTMFLKIRKNIKDKKDKSKVIFEMLIEDSFYKNAKIIALYKSLETEVDTNQIIDYSLRIGKIIVLPRVEEDNLVFYKVLSNNEVFEKSKLGVEEPKEIKENAVIKNNIDLVVLPGVCFDKKKNRIGFGKGYYDRFLEEKKIKTIGLCFDEQVLKDGFIQAEKNDIIIDKLITEKNIYL